MSDVAPSSSPQQPRPSPGLREIAMCLVITWGLGLGILMWLSQQVDLRDHPGPAGVGMMLDTLHFGPEHTPLIRLTRVVTEMAGGNVIAAGRWMSRLGYLAWVGGATLAGLALAGPLPGIGAGLLAATWALSLHLGLLFGPDGVALGFTCLGVGISWVAATRGGGWDIFPLLLGVLLAIGATQLKVISLPILPLFAFTPLLVSGGLVRRGIMAMVVGLTLVWGYYEILAPHIAATRATTGGAMPFVWEPAHGWDLLERKARLLPLGHFYLLAGLAFVGALWPGRTFKLRMLVMVAGLFLVGQTATQLEGVLRPRYVISASLPLLVVAGLWGGMVAGQMRRWPGVWLLPLLLLPTMALLDSLAYTHVWSEARHLYHGSLPDTLPPLPRWLVGQYRPEPHVIDVNELAVAGMVEMDGMVAHSPQMGVASLPLQDSRHNHFLLAANIYRRPHQLLEYQRCCPSNMAPRACAKQVLGTIEREGWQLILPRLGTNDIRLPLDQVPWHTALVEEAHDIGLEEKVTPWWHMFSGSGSSVGPGPCVPESQAPAGGMPPPPPQ